MKEIEDTQTNGKTFHAHGLEELILVKCPYYPKQSTNLVQSLSNSNSIFFHRNRTNNTPTTQTTHTEHYSPEQQNTHFFRMHMELSPESLNWYQKTEIIPCIFSDHNALKLELNHKEKFGGN